MNEQRFHYVVRSLWQRILVSGRFLPARLLQATIKRMYLYIPTGTLPSLFFDANILYTPLYKGFVRSEVQFLSRGTYVSAYGFNVRIRWLVTNSQGLLVTRADDVDLVTCM